MPERAGLAAVLVRAAVRCEWVGFALAVLGAIGVYLVPNASAKRRARA